MGYNDMDELTYQNQKHNLKKPIAYQLHNKKLTHSFMVKSQLYNLRSLAPYHCGIKISSIIHTEHKVYPKVGEDKIIIVIIKNVQVL